MFVASYKHHQECDKAFRCVHQETSYTGLYHINHFRPLRMAKGRQGFLLEGWKFAIYLLVPITASIYYNNPENQKKSADYWQYVKYPANPSTGWKEQIELMQSQQKQREIYRQQLQQLNDSTTSNAVTCDKELNESDMDTDKGSRWRWLRWIGLGPKES